MIKLNDGTNREYIVPNFASVLYYYEVIPETVVQYSGLKDKYGRKIYREDRITGEYYNVLANASRKVDGVVKFDKGCFFIIDTILLLLREIIDIEIKEEEEEII